MPQGRQVPRLPWILAMPHLYENAANRISPKSFKLPIRAPVAHGLAAGNPKALEKYVFNATVIADVDVSGGSRVPSVPHDLLVDCGSHMFRVHRVLL